MTEKQYRQARVIVIFFVSAIVSVSVVKNSYFLSAVGVLTGIFFMILVRSKTKFLRDEREICIREKAAQLTYAIFAPTLGMGAFLLLIPYQKLSPVFAKGEFIYLESLGMVFAYLTLFLIAIYAISYHFLQKKFGGRQDEK